MNGFERVPFGVIANLGAFTLVAWLVRHTFTHTIPRLAKDFKESLLAQRQEFLEQLRQQREDFKEELKAQREKIANTIDELDKKCNKHFED